MTPSAFRLVPYKTFSPRVQFCLPRGMKISQEMKRWFSQAGTIFYLLSCLHSRLRERTNSQFATMRKSETTQSSLQPWRTLHDCQEQFKVRYCRVSVNMWTGRAGDRAANPVIRRQPCPPLFVCVSTRPISFFHPQTKRNKTVVLLKHFSCLDSSLTRLGLVNIIVFVPCPVFFLFFLPGSGSM